MSALPPDNLAWQLGKTAASIKFVNDAEKYITTCDDKDLVKVIRFLIEAIKTGKLVL